jgi:hypothetical protein
MEISWGDFLTQTLATLVAASIIGIFSYISSEKFRKWVASSGKRIAFGIKWLMSQWKYILSLFLIILLEIAIYSFTKSFSITAIIFLLHLILISFLYKLFPSKPSPLTFQPSDISDVLTTNRWKLVFRPPDLFKLISFLPNGIINEGQNKNEHTWRLENEKLELIQEDGRVHSRFKFDKKSFEFIHTNDSDTLSIRDQIIRLA